MTSTSAEADELQTERYAVVHEGKKVGEVHIVGEGKNFELRIRASSAEVAEQLRSVLAEQKGAAPGATEADKPNADPKPDGEHGQLRATREQIRGAIVKRIEGLGFTMQQLPTRDVQVKLEIDVGSGRRVARTSNLHEFSESSGLGRRVLDAFSNVGATARATMEKGIADALSSGNATAAAQALVEWASIGPFLGVNDTDLALARLVPVDALAANLRQEVLSLRLGLAGRLSDLGEKTEADLHAHIAEFGADMSVAERASLSGFEGAMARAKGYTATAIRRWKAALLGDDSTRGHAYLDLSRAYPTGDPEAARYAELAADAMLQAGDRTAAVNCMQRLAACLLSRDPQRAVEWVDTALGILASNLLDRDLKGGLLHYKAIALDKLGLTKAALDAAIEAAAARRDLAGTEQERHASLSIASLFARNLGETDRAEELGSEAALLANSFNDPRVQLRQAAGAVVLDYDSAIASQLQEEAEKLGELHVAALLTVIKASHEGTAAQRLESLERALARLRSAKAPRGDLAVALQALAHELADQGETGLAIRYYRDVLTIDPFNKEARQNTAVLLLQSERWDECVEFFEAQRELFGDRPGILFGLGKSYLNVGDVNAAATALMLSRAADGADEKLKNEAEKLIADAIQRGGKPDLTKKPPQAELVTHSEFEAKLQEFTRFLAAEKRMSLWKSSGPGEHKWVEHPESRAQDALGMFLSGCFGKRVEVLEAVAAGAGFVDLYVTGENGFRAIVELKMLGSGYSSTYAFAGENQIAHYMQQKEVSIGYLVIFDARKQDFGKRPEVGTDLGGKTVRVLFADVRPSSPSKQR